MKYKIYVNRLILIILTYYFKGKSAQKFFIGFNGPIGFYKNIREGYIQHKKMQNKKNLNQI